MKRFVPVALLSLAALGAAPAAEAVIPDKGSIAIFANAGPSIPFEGDYDIGFHLTAGGEYYFTKNFALRGTFSYARSGASGGSDATVGGLEAAAVYTSRKGDWAPFVFGGFGIFTVDPPASGSEQKLGAVFGAGTEYFLDRRTSITGELTGRFVGSAGGRSSSYAGAAFGIKYHF
jgi:hypothetical protein